MKLTSARTTICTHSTTEEMPGQGIAKDRSAQMRKRDLGVVEFMKDGYTNRVVNRALE